MSDHRIQSAEVDLSLERIERAASTIAPVFRDTPQFIDDQLRTAIGRRVIVKVETGNPIRSFKGRGTDFLISELEPDRHLVCVSSGNFGQGVAFAARTKEMPAVVFSPTGVNPSKLDRMRSFGATVIEIGDVVAAKQAAREYVAERPERLFIEDGSQPMIAEGAGTIGVELLRDHRPDTLVIPVGDGALITGVARWVKEHAPDTQIVGVCATGAPAMLNSWQAGRPMPTDRADTIAEGIQIMSPVAESVARMRHLVDHMVLVDDSAMLDAMRLALTTIGQILEPSGAAGLAAITTHDLPGDTLATILTGSNVHPDLLRTLL